MSKSTRANKKSGKKVNKNIKPKVSAVAEFDLLRNDESLLDELATSPIEVYAARATTVPSSYPPSVCC